MSTNDQSRRQNMAAKAADYTVKDKQKLIVDMLNRMNLSLVQVQRILADSLAKSQPGQDANQLVSAVMDGIISLTGIYQASMDGIPLPATPAVTPARRPAVDLSHGLAVSVQPILADLGLPQPLSLQTQATPAGMLAPFEGRLDQIVGAESIFFDFVSESIHPCARGPVQLGDLGLDLYSESILSIPVENLELFPEGFYGYGQHPGEWRASPTELYLKNERLQYVWVMHGELAMPHTQLYIRDIKDSRNWIEVRTMSASAVLYTVRLLERYMAAMKTRV